MRFKLLIIFMITLTMLITGCGDDKEDSSSTNETEQSANDNKNVVKMPNNVVIADDNFSNLQLTDYKKPVYDKHTIWERQELGLPMELPEITPYIGGKIAYLTFDDGPDNKNTPKILDILKNYGVLATFYVCGNMVELNPNVLKRIFEEGHAIGNHSYNHNYKELYPSTEKYLKQINDTDEVIKEIIGVRPLTIRTPGGRVGMWTPEYEPLMKACGYAEHDWNVSVEDATAKKPNAQQIIANVKQQMKYGFKDNAAIILMHSNNGKEQTVDALPGIIEFLVNEGYDFGVVTPMTPQPW